MTSIVFFIGILLVVATLGAHARPRDAGKMAHQHAGRQDAIVILFGLLSAIIVDNVPLVVQLPTSCSTGCFVDG